MSSKTTVVLPAGDIQLEHLNRIAQRPKLDIRFYDLKYSVRDNKEGWRQILKSINGKFCCGELTAILGPSGAGKTTLLNILAGYVTAGVEGTINYNSYPKNKKIFNKLSTYIMQEDILQPRLTVKESMTFAANLKLGRDVEVENRIAVTEEVISLLGLRNCLNTYSEFLSGGERKRLSVGLELINNPPVIFLDEPTTGLDNFSVKQCISLLKKISKLDRTVVCTIHQPPASLFHFFDQVYIIADGYCVYNGTPSQMVPFLSSVNYPCPSNNTPADYIIELVHLQPSVVETLRIATNNGQITIKEKKISRTANVPNYRQFFQFAINRQDTEFATGYGNQFLILTTRMLLQMKRNRTGLLLQLIHHIMSGLLVTSIFVGIGQDAVKIVSSVKYCMACNVFYTYTNIMIPALMFPLELQLLKREYFNRWYSLKAYYSALTFSTFLLLMILSVLFCTIVYFFTNQPREMDRYFGFCIICISVALTSQGLGYMIGSVFSITGGTVVGPSTMAILLAVGVYGMGYNEPPKAFYKFLAKLSFVRNGILGLCGSLFYQREPLMCYDDDCLFTHAEELLNVLQVPITDYKSQLTMIFLWMVIFRVMGYLLLKCRLNVELSSRVVSCFQKVRYLISHLVHL